MTDQKTLDTQPASLLNAGLAVELRAMSDNAYCAYIEQMRNQLCLGWESKVANGKFTRDNLDAFMRAAEWLGRHKALHEVSVMTANVKLRGAALSRRNLPSIKLTPD